MGVTTNSRLGNPQKSKRHKPSGIPHASVKSNPAVTVNDPSQEQSMPELLKSPSIIDWQPSSKISATVPVTGLLTRFTISANQSAYAGRIVVTASANMTTRIEENVFFMMVAVRFEIYKKLAIAMPRCGNTVEIRSTVDIS